MNSEPASLERAWSRRKFWMLLLCVFAAQLVFLFFFGRPISSQLAIPASTTSFRMLAGNISPEELDSLMVNDPTLFVVPSRSSFSGAAWMNVKPMDYSPAEWSEPPSWLSLPASMLTAAFDEFLQANAKPLMQISQKTPPSEPAPSTEVQLPPSHAVATMAGDITRRFAGTLPELNAWQSAEPLDRTTIQVAVNDTGQIVSARIINRSGLPSADQAALKTAASLHFLPAAGTNLIWGTISFPWKTEPLPATNSTSGTTETR